MSLPLLRLCANAKNYLNRKGRGQFHLDIAISLRPRVRYTPRGWQADLMLWQAERSTLTLSTLVQAPGGRVIKKPCFQDNRVRARGPTAGSQANAHMTQRVTQDPESRGLSQSYRSRAGANHCPTEVPVSPAQCSCNISMLQNRPAPWVSSFQASVFPSVLRGRAG